MNKTSTSSPKVDSTSSSNDSAPAEPKTGSTLDELANRIGESDLEPDLARQLAENWQKFFGAMVLVLLGVWLLGEFRTASQKEREDASFRFQNTQDAYLELVGEATMEGEGDSSIDKAKTVFNENVTLLEKGSSGSVYERLAPLYLAQASIDAGEVEKAKAILSKYGIDTPNDIPAEQSVNSVEQFVGELASLLYARVLTISSAEDRQAQREYLSALCERSRFVNIEALLLLYRTAQNAEEKDSAKSLATKIVTARPEIANAIKDAFSSLGVAL